MENSNTSTTIIKFHIGRGGRFNNQGYTSFVGISRIDEGDSYNSLFLNEETGEYLDCDGNSAELTLEEALTGVGTIDLDGEYDTTYTKYVTDITEKELEIILSEKHWEAESVIQQLCDIHDCDKDELFLHIA
ncbi:hypothetical protein EZY14_002635 [Kordia sp. TARA_039_SRF]|nr:hypothetical protein EZY14_002635 [Kordia sp. TARA_039_SRF]